MSCFSPLQDRAKREHQRLQALRVSPVFVGPLNQRFLQETDDRPMGVAPFKQLVAGAHEQQAVTPCILRRSIGGHPGDA